MSTVAAVEGTHSWTQAVKDLMTIAFIMTVFLLAFATAAVVRCRTQRKVRLPMRFNEKGALLFTIGFPVRSTLPHAVSIDAALCGCALR